MLPDQLLEFRVREGEKNASAKTPQTVSLIAQELPVVLDRFLDLTEEDALAVFGETGSEVERKFIAYREGLKLSPAGQQWAFGDCTACSATRPPRRAWRSGGLTAARLPRLRHSATLLAF